jgi:hypothetical protein
MLKKLHLIIFILAFPLLAQYSFNFICLGGTFQIVPLGEVATFHFRLENTGEEQDIYEFNCTLIEGVPDWDVTYCIDET